MRKMCTLITSKGTDIDENIANQNHATRTRTPKPGYLNLSNNSETVNILKSVLSTCLIVETSYELMNTFQNLYRFRRYYW